MKRKTYNLIVAVLGGVTAIASGVVAYLEISYTPAIVAAIPVAQTAILEICGMFVKDQTTKLKTFTIDLSSLQGFYLTKKMHLFR